MRVLLLLCSLLLPPLTQAAIVSCPTASLGASQVATGISANAMTGHAQTSIGIQAKTTAGTATAGMVVCCTGNCGASGDWAASGATAALTTTASGFFYLQSPPACLYALSVSVCTGCSVDSVITCGGP